MGNRRKQCILKQTHISVGIAQDMMVRTHDWDMTKCISVNLHWEKRVWQPWGHQQEMDEDRKGKKGRRGRKVFKVYKEKKGNADWHSGTTEGSQSGIVMMWLTVHNNQTGKEGRKKRGQDRLRGQLVGVKGKSANALKPSLGSKKTVKKARQESHRWTNREGKKGTGQERNNNK